MFHWKAFNHTNHMRLTQRLQVFAYSSRSLSSELTLSSVIVIQKVKAAASFCVAIESF